MIITVIFVVFLPKPHDDVVLPEEMKVSIEKAREGYIITINDLGDYKDSSYLYLDLSKLRWVIWDARNRVEISSGLLSNTSDTVWLNESLPNGRIDVMEKIYIRNPEHSFGGYYFILTPPDTEFRIIHVKIPI
ncbi:MAG: hypothetical protein QXU48_01425 [Thermoplasmata archaeon]